MISTWQKRRSEFNHDWLKNRYLPALAKWINILDNRVEDQEFQKEFPRTILNQWLEYGPEAYLLAKRFECEMSPRVLLERYPLSRLPGSTRDWLGPLVHELWLSRYPVRQWVADTVAAVCAANAAYETLRDSIASKENSTVEELRSLRGTFTRFQGLCQGLARTIEEFPSKLLII
jgi:hypothetical protein